VAYNSSATTELGEPPVTGSKTLWYNYTPRTAGFAMIETVYASYPHDVTVFTGNSINSLLEIGTTQGSAGDSQVLAAISFPVQARVTYHIAIGAQSNYPIQGGVIMGLIGPGKNIFTNAGRFSGFLGDGQEDFINLAVSSSGALSGREIINGKALSLSGALNLSGSFAKTLSGEKVQLYLDPTGFSSTLTGSITALSGTYPIALQPTLYGAADPAPTPARFTLLIAPDPGAGPPGYGAGTFCILKNGALTFAGRLADGTAFSTSGFISNSGAWDLYLPLYASQGRLTGVINFQPVAGQSAFSGSLTWVKPKTSKAAGFTAAPTMIGSPYTPQRPALTLATPPSATFSSGGLASAVTFPSLVQVGGSVKALGLTLKFNEASGIITGSFMPPGAPKSLTVYGVTFQEQSLAAGYFNVTGGNGCFQFGD
jgi:hypothetical protein